MKLTWLILVLSWLSLTVGVLLLPKEGQGVGMIGIAGCFAIYARIAQANAPK